MTSPNLAAEIEAYARLAIDVGANVQPTQTVVIWALVSQVALVQAIARQASIAGARAVTVIYADQDVVRGTIEHGAPEAIGWTPAWLGRAFVPDGSTVFIRLLGADPDIYAGLDETRVARATDDALERAWCAIVATGSAPWTEVAAPNEAWARSIVGEPDVERLWRAVLLAARATGEDPVRDWRDHIDHLRSRADKLTERRLDAIHLQGPGTDLRIGLLAAARWTCCGQSRFGCVENIPTEEVFTSPDRLRTDGVICATSPVVVRGVSVRDLELRFEGGRIIGVAASSGRDAVMADIESDEGGGRLGEIALVDGTSAVRTTGLTYRNGLLDENAAAHLAWGHGFAFVAPDGADGINESGTHVDVMIGVPEVRIDGIDDAGNTIPLIVDDRWKV